MGRKWQQRWHKGQAHNPPIRPSQPPPHTWLLRLWLAVGARQRGAHHLPCTPAAAAAAAAAAAGAWLMFLPRLLLCCCASLLCQRQRLQRKWCCWPGARTTAHTMRVEGGRQAGRMTHGGRQAALGRQAGQRANPPCCTRASSLSESCPSYGCKEGGQCAAERCDGNTGVVANPHP